MGFIGLGLLLLVVVICLDLIIAEDPLKPNKVKFNGWSWAGIVILVTVLGWSYDYMAGTPDILKDSRGTHFRPSTDDNYGWFYRAPIDRIALDPQDKQFIEQEAQVVNPDVKSFTATSVEYEIVGSWLPVDYMPPRFYTTTVAYRGNATLNNDEVVEQVVVFSSLSYKSELAKWLDNFEPQSGGTNTTTTRRRRGAPIPINSLPGRIK